MLGEFFVSKPRPPPPWGGAPQTVVHSKHEYVRGEIHTNTVESAFSLLKRGIMGTWHQISGKHLDAYLDEMTCSFNKPQEPLCLPRYDAETYSIGQPRI
jgi:hypothetical protein